MIAIVQQAIRGEVETDSPEATFATLISRQSRFVFRVAYAVLRNVQDAEDVTQETFLRVYKKGSWNAIEDERAFLARVAWRIAVDRAPKRIPLSATDSLLAAGSDPEQAAIQNDWNCVVRNLIQVLPEDLRVPLCLSSIDELKSSEIARILGIPEGTVRTRLLRARQILKQKLERFMEKANEKR